MKIILVTCNKQNLATVLYVIQPVYSTRLLSHRRGQWYIILSNPPRHTARQLPRGQQGLFVAAVSLEGDGNV